MGTMSGTSCDGLDVVLIEVCEKKGFLDLVEFEGFTYPEALAERLRGLGNMQGKSAEKLSHDWTRWVGQKLQSCLHNWTRSGRLMDLVGLSGHTWYHEPGGVGTAAIGDAEQLCAALGLPVVADYRSADVAAGGQGAPLVPLFDAHVFGGHVACVNLGGIANATILPAEPSGKVRAWDVCGCNLLLNRQAMRRGLSYDQGGAMAAKGTVDVKVLAQLNSWKYVCQAPPKSLSAEDLAPLHRWLDEVELPEDACATAVEWMAMSLTAALVVHARPGQVLVSGGGAFHLFLMERWAALLGDQWTLDVPSHQWVEGKEAAAFGWLALRTARGEITSLASVTGATQDVRGGVLFGNFAASDELGT